MVKDEADIIGYTIEHMLGQVDAVLVADNGSTDGTSGILADLEVRYGARCIVVDDPETGYYQAQKMTSLALEAADMGAEWVVPFDADEWWYCPHGKCIADRLDELSRFAVARAALYDHRTTGVDDETEANPFVRMGWRHRKPAELVKVAFRPRPQMRLEMGNHGVNYGTGPVDGELVVRHFPYRDPEQMIRKARNGADAYAATNLPPEIGKHWRDYGRFLDAGGPVAIEQIFYEWFHFDDPADEDQLIFDPAP